MAREALGTGHWPTDDTELGAQRASLTEKLFNLAGPILGVKAAGMVAEGILTIETADDVTAVFAAGGG